MVFDRVSDCTTLALIQASKGDKREFGTMVAIKEEASQLLLDIT